ncbi:MAG: PIN domain-containing protein [archaeon]
MKILLDTNFLLVPYTFKVDIFRELERICDKPYEICVLKQCIDELNSIIGKQKGEDKAAAKLALELIKAKDLKIISEPTKAHVDDILFGLSEKGYVVATQDKGLRDRLKRAIFLRQRKYLTTKGVKCFT